MSPEISATPPLDGRRVPPAQRWQLLWRRLAAFVYDLLPLTAMGIFTAGAVLALRGGELAPFGSLWHQLLLLAGPCLYYVVSWRNLGQTLGMRAWRLRCRRDDGSPLGNDVALLRFATGILVLCSGGLGLLWIMIDPCGRAWHDRLSGTMVERL